MANSSHINYNQTRAAFGPPRINPDQSVNINAIECSRTNRSGPCSPNAMQQSVMVSSDVEQSRVHTPSSPPGVPYRQRPQHLANLEVPRRKKEVTMVGGLVPRTPPRPFYNVQIQEHRRPDSPNIQSPYLPQQNQQGLAVHPRHQDYLIDRDRNVIQSPPRPYYPPPRHTPDRYTIGHNHANGHHMFTDSHLDFSLADLTEYKDIKYEVDNRHKQEFRQLGVYDPNAPGSPNIAREREKQELIERQNEEMLQLKRDAHLANVRKHQFNRRILEVVSHGPNSARHSSQTIEESSENKIEHLENFKKYSDVVISRVLQKHAQQIFEIKNNRSPETTDSVENQLIDDLKIKHAEEMDAMGKDLDERYKRYMENVEHPVIQITETTTTGPNNEVITERVTTEGGDENGEEDQIIHVENQSPEENSVNLSIGTVVTHILNKQHEVLHELQLAMDDAIKNDTSNDVKVHYENKMDEVVLYYRAIMKELLSNMQQEYHNQLADAGFKEFENVGNPCAANHCGEMQGSHTGGDRSIANQSGIQYGPQNQTQHSTTNESVVVIGPENNPIRQQTIRSEIIEYGPENQPSNQKSPCSGGNQRGVQFAPVNLSQRSMRSMSPASPAQCQGVNESQLRREDYASFRSCLITLFEKQNALINHLKERQLQEQQESPGVSLKEKHDLQLKLIQDYNLKEFNEIWQMIIKNNPTILRKLPPISVPPQLEDSVRSIADNVENAQSLSNSVSEECSNSNSNADRSAMFNKMMKFHAAEGHKTLSNFETEGLGISPNKRNAVSMNVNIEKIFKTRSDVFTGTPLIDRNIAMNPNIAPPNASANICNANNNNSVHDGNINSIGNNINSSKVNSCTDSHTFSANVNNRLQSSRISPVGTGVSMNNAAMLKPSPSSSGPRVNNSCGANSISKNASVNNIRNVSRPMINACTDPSSSIANTSLPITTNSRPIADVGSSSNVVTTVTTTKTQRGCNQALTQTSETVTTKEPENVESAMGTSCPCSARKSNQSASINACPCMSMLPSVSELNELEETEKCELNRCLRRWQSCRRDIVLQMSKK